MSFKAIQAKIADKSGVGKEKAGARLPSTTRKSMGKVGISTRHGIPKNVSMSLRMAQVLRGWGNMAKKKKKKGLNEMIIEAKK
jgi:hypothetical protein